MAAAAALPKPWGPTTALHPGPHPRLHGGMGNWGSLVSNVARMVLPAPCRGVSSPHPGGAHLAASPGGDISALASACCHHPWATEITRAISAVLHSRPALCIFFVMILWCTVHLSDFLFLHCLMLIRQIYDTPYQLDD